MNLDSVNAWLLDHQLLVLTQLLVFSGIFLFWLVDASPAPRPRGPLTKANQINLAPKLNEFKNPMQAPDVKLNAPLDTPYTTEQLKQYNGLTPGQPIYVAMKGIIFDGPLRPSPALSTRVDALSLRSISQEGDVRSRSRLQRPSLHICMTKGTNLTRFHRFSPVKTDREDLESRPSSQRMPYRTTPLSPQRNWAFWRIGSNTLPRFVVVLSRPHVCSLVVRSDTTLSERLWIRIRS